MSKTNTNVTENLRKQIEAAVTAAMEQGALPAGEIPSFVIEEPADRSHGDIATNVAMAGARVFRMAPVKAAQIILDHIDLENSFIEKCEIAGPGFINFFLSKRYFAAVLREIENEGERYGESDYGQGKKVMVEFVSANPTGPMHLGNARGGALGDCLAAVLDKAGYQAYREFYVNDAGNQIEKFAASLEARYMQLFDESFPFPEDGYQGSDIIERAEQFKEKFGGSLTAVSSEERRKALVDFALPLNIKRMQDDMAKYKIDFDNWFMESLRENYGEENVAYLPHDHHELAAMVCPRALLMLGNPDFPWLADPSAYVSMNGAIKVWEQFGIADRVGYSIVPGHGHCQLPEVQFPEVEAYIDRFLLGKENQNTKVRIAPESYKDINLNYWIPWK